ncbi:hypothetical protein Taro_012248 [Colocasia esculenta]|uniref:Uncharacterized protein n=1 Tax=Colocasia esculenta TaxID=4460 RepID=A0A843U3G5_COLES|nr:hypothetical protein [Colocasia esculenta]
MPSVGGKKERKENLAEIRFRSARSPADGRSEDGDAIGEPERRRRLRVPDAGVPEWGRRPESGGQRLQVPRQPPLPRPPLFHRPLVQPGGNSGVCMRSRYLAARFLRFHVFFVELDGSVAEGPVSRCELLSESSVSWKREILDVFPILKPFFVHSEEQLIKTNSTNILIRSLQLNKQRSDAKEGKAKATAESNRSKRVAERTLEGRSSAKKANVASGSASTGQDGSRLVPSDKELQDELISRLKDD